MVLSSNNIPDSKGINAYLRDKSFSKLLEYYCGKELFDQVENKFIELGEVVGSEYSVLSVKRAQRTSHKTYYGTEKSHIFSKHCTIYLLE